MREFKVTVDWLRRYSISESGQNWSLRQLEILGFSKMRKGWMKVAEKRKLTQSERCEFERISGDAKRSRVAASQRGRREAGSGTRPDEQRARASEKFSADAVTFGMHAGKPWSEVPTDYLSWMLRKFRAGRIRDLASAELDRRKGIERPKPTEGYGIGETKPKAGAGIIIPDLVLPPHDWAAESKPLEDGPAPWEGDYAPEVMETRDRIRAIGQSGRRETSDLDEEFRRVFGRT